METFSAAHVQQAQGSFLVVQKNAATPGRREVVVQVKACGVCHSDHFTKDGQWPGLQFPRSPGHEIAGVILKIGEDVTNWKIGQRVGIGWHGGHCGNCGPCRRGDFINCVSLRVPGIHYDGGYGGQVVAPIEALAAIPDALSFEEAAPILCAGVTTFNALRHSGACAGDWVAIQGIGGLGHLGVQFANKMGFQVAALSKGSDKEALAKKLGAHVYIDTEKESPAKALQKLGGAKVILATAPSGQSITPLFDGLGHQGTLLVVGASADPIPVSAFQFLTQTRGIRGWASGTSMDSEDALRFCAITGIRPMIEKFPLKDVSSAYDRMMANKVRFRAVIIHG